MVGNGEEFKDDNSSELEPPLVQFLYIEKEQQGAQQAQDMEVQNIECDDPHEKVRALMVEVESYPRLVEAIPLLETDFFRSPIPEEKRKEIIYEPIDDYVHRKLKNPNTMIQGNEDLKFAHTMRELLSDLASSITQNRIDNLHKSMELPGRVPQLVEPTVKPLVENKQLDALLAAKKPTARSRRNKRSPFRPRQQTAAVGRSVLFYLDNTTTLAYVRKFGGATSPKLLEVSKKLWSHCIETNTRPQMSYTEQEAAQILQLVPGQSITTPGCNGTAPTVVPVKSNTTDPTEISTGKDNYDNNYANVEVCDLGSNSGKSQNSRAHTNTGRQISTTQEQILVADGMENQRRTLEQESLTYLALDLITANTRSILDPTNNLNTKELTSKTCWLIAVCGFLGASDIHRVDDEKTEISNKSIKLIICAPKEKRNSSPIEILVEIKAHSNEILCPVIAYRIYKQRIPNIPFPRPHANNKNLIMNHLFRNTKDFSKPLTVYSISRIIKSITIKAVKDNKGITPKDRAIGTTIAARTGISTDEILTQANWSNYYMFSSYYKLSNDSYSNITESVLSELT
ncbi:hypothetical protein BB561_000985 [Smittium simulii]|uniref:Uncharacterized protein n=1 Tax=Smittium simulii TaxID=133385 RepID=A0A2T9YWN4_9FUNG|nr:hypothetical protein BB561_000985 [Smittium simulii]